MGVIWLPNILIIYDVLIIQMCVSDCYYQHCHLNFVAIICSSSWRKIGMKEKVSHLALVLSSFGTLFLNI